MRPEFADRLRCPRCRTAAPFTLRADASDAREVRAGALTCGRCGHVAEIRDGIVDALHEPPDFVVREAAGLGRFADVMRADGWTREDILALPQRDDGYWYAQAVLMDQVLDTVPFEPGQRLLDLGSNTCWASARFAQEGLDVTALDIAEHEMQGLRTADWQMDAKDVFFERVLGVMFDLPFADASFDVVWACEVLHHNHRANLAATYREAYRVLRPGGRLVVANEPLRTLRTPKLDPGEEVAAFEGHEHAYLRRSYTSLARRAGFTVDVRGPRYHALFGMQAPTLHGRMSVRDLYATATLVAAGRSKRLRRAVLAARAYVLGGTALHMVCTKPGDPVGV
jgi:SAM-dependent methyltransferase